MWGGGGNYRTLEKIRDIQQKNFDEENLSFRIASLLKCPFEQSTDCRRLDWCYKIASLIKCLFEKSADNRRTDWCYNIASLLKRLFEQSVDCRRTDWLY